MDLENTLQSLPEVQLETPSDQPVSEPTVQSQDQTSELQAQQLQAQAAVEAQKEKNLRILRERSERAERERDELARLLRQQMEAQKPAPMPEEDLDIHLGENDLAEGKHLSKMQIKIGRLEKQLKQYQQQSSEQMVEAKIKAQYPDFDKVVSAENVKAFSAAYPEIAASLSSSQDLYSKAVSTYQMINKLGIAPQEDLYAQEREIAQRNAAKPRPLTSVNPQQGDSPISKANAFANGLTEDLKKQLVKEMADAMKNR